MHRGMAILSATTSGQVSRLQSKMSFLKRFFQSEAGAAVLWALSALVLAAAIAPWAYRAGINLAEAAASKDLSGPLEWLGEACGRAKFSRFFSRSLEGSAMVLLPLLLWRIRLVRAGKGLSEEARGRVSWKSGLIQVGVGCVITGGMLWGVGMVLEGLGAYAPVANPPAPGKFLRAILIPAVAAAPLEELLFRGLLLGLWLKFARPLAACVGTSFCFALVHFLQAPDGSIIADPAAPSAGFELLGKILLHFTDPRVFATDFATLFVIGMILARARVRTGALWFSIGLHAGWIAAFKGFNLLHRTVSGHPLHPWGVGESLRSGLFPLVGLGLTAVICHFVLRRFEAGRPVA